MPEMTTAQALDHIVNSTRAAADEAERAGLPMLRYLFEMALMEAEEQMKHLPA